MQSATIERRCFIRGYRGGRPLIGVPSEEEPITETEEIDLSRPDEEPEIVKFTSTSFPKGFLANLCWSRYGLLIRQLASEPLTRGQKLGQSCFVVKGEGEDASVTVYEGGAELAINLSKPADLEWEICNVMKNGPHDLAFVVFLRGEGEISVFTFDPRISGEIVPICDVEG